MKSKIIILILSLLNFNNVKSQITYDKVLWDKECDCPVAFASINNSLEYVISNENGYFSMTTKDPNVEINMLGYYSKKINLDELKDESKVFLDPKVFVLDEVVIEQNQLFKEMLGSILKDYALEPHVEKFYLRAVLKKNNSIIKLIDLSGIIKKETLFNTKTKPMPENNYTIHIENMRKSGIINSNYDFTVINFEEFFKRHNSFYISPQNFNLKYNKNIDNTYTKISATQKNATSVGNTYGYFIVNNNTKNFEKASLNIDYIDDFTVISKDLKNRTKKFNVESTFKKNKNTDKFQINNCNINIEVEVLFKDEKDIFNLSFSYFAEPINNGEKIKNNVNHKIDIFDLNIKYNSEYWKNHEILPLTDEMQEFINKVNSTGKNSDFRTKTNIK
ncbi:hypothetical protein EKM05_10670 [Flavobacterium sp. GSP27]|uniref:hypothetical protein n=1 Tax=Flavobacterium sp. GSP27 TaxID=2497489 RepID=UPI000F826D62|nr:hypothetical protein [Flavobacterium sp. GSP27]RTZ07686.1 hypothetical protein EKM05_10670 [Flavobacterium sp. GSP27]